MLQYRWSWQGGRIGQGLSVFNLLGSDFTGNINAANSAIRTWFNGLRTTIPDDVTISGPPEVLQVNDADGQLIDVQALTPVAAIVGSSTAAFASPAGRVVRWNTPVVLAGRRLIGRTFLVPSVAVFNVTGSIDPATITADAALHAALVSTLQSNGTPLGVWSRKNGSIHEVSSGTTLARPTTLRTRND